MLHSALFMGNFKLLNFSLFNIVCSVHPLLSLSSMDGQSKQYLVVCCDAISQGALNIVIS